MANKVKVYGQSQKWTALGIVAAYLELHPKATLEDLQKAFPTSESLHPNPRQNIIASTLKPASLVEIENTMKYTFIQKKVVSLLSKECDTAEELEYVSST